MKCWAIAVGDGGGVLGGAVNVLGDVMKDCGGIIILSQVGSVRSRLLRERNGNEGLRTVRC